MKKLLTIVLALLCVAMFVSCKQNRGEAESFGPAYFAGEVLEVYEESFLVEISDMENCYFSDEKVHVRDINAKENYAVGDQVKIQYGGVFPQFAPPQVGAESIVKIDAEGNEIPTKEKAVMVGGDLIPAIYVSDTLYTSAYHIACCRELSDNCTYLGEVTECVGSGNMPTENFQANTAGVGAEIYQYQSVIYVLQNGVYCPYVEAEIQPSGFFDYRDSLRASYHNMYFNEETGKMEQEITEILLSEENASKLIELLNPYGDTLTSDVLKCDYLRHYCIEIDDRLTLTIDPELGNYGESGDSYMMVMESASGAQMKGTYINAELVEFLEEMR